MKTRLIFLAVVVCGLLRVSAQSIVINLQPTNQVVAANGTVNLSVTASSTNSLFYQWWKDNTMLAGATNATLSLANAGVTNSGVYYVVITNAARAMAISYPADVAVGNPSLLAWGYNSYGQLGNGNNVSARWPIVVTSNVVAVAVGATQISGGDTFEHSLFVKSDGTLWAMGYNGYGQLGNGTYNSTNVPVYVTSNVVSVAAGASHSLFVKSDGTLWAMGWNNYGQLGNGSAVTQANVPVYVTNNVVSAAAGCFHSLFVKSDGKLWGMGLNHYGELATSLIHNTTVPICISSNVVSVAAGCWSTLFVKSDGKLWGVGWNQYGDLGIGSTSEQDSPVCMSSNVVSVAAGDNYSMFVKSDGTLWAAGWNNNDQLGCGLASSIAVPIMVHSLGVASLAPGPIGNHTLEVGVPFNPFINSQPASQVVTNGGTVNLSVGITNSLAAVSYQWWKDSALLAGATNAALSLTNAGVTNSGVYYVVITNTAGGITISYPADVAVGNPSLLAWGYNNFGQLGNGTYNNTNLPITVMSNVVSAAAGGGHSLFVKSDGTLWAMGYNGNGQLGNATVAYATNVPVYVTSNVVSVAAGQYHSLFLKRDGTLWTMGYNYYGQLGNGTATDSSVPVFVTNNVVSMAAGAYHSLFVMSDGTLWGMGADGQGELGPNGGWRTGTPVYVTNNVVSVAAGSGHSLFVMSDGTLWGMGANGSGQLGVGTINYSGTDGDGNPYSYDAPPSPVLAPAYITNNVVSMAAGGNSYTVDYNPVYSFGHSLFVKSDGTLWAMGANGSGQLGNGTLNESDWPAYVTNNVVSVSAGYDSSLFVKKDGTLWAMGDNTYDQLGNGSAVTQTTLPVLAYSAGVASLAAGPRAAHTLEVGGSLPPPTITVQPVASQTVSAGTNVAFSVTATGTSPLSYQWFFGGNAISGATNSNYGIASAAPVNSGNYTVVIANIFGSVTSSAASLTVVPLTISLQPTNQAVTNGGTVTLSVVITNSPAAVSYQWWKDGAMVPGATNATLSLTNAGVANSGVYYAVATNLCGMMAISSPADVTVGSPSLLAWGHNNYGQLGIGSSVSQTNVPSVVVGNVVSAAVGQYHSLFVKSDGTLWAMGWNYNGQLGIGSAVSSTNVPVYVTNNVVSVAAGHLHSLFLKSDGTLWTMGANTNGQLGIGSAVGQTNVPVYVTNNVVSVVAGAWSSLFLKSDGTLWGMGDNEYGQFGIGTTASTNVPVYVTNNVASVASGRWHSLFVKSDGTLWTMGYNNYGQLGNGTTTDAHAPVYVTNNVISVAAGGYHSLFIKSGGTLWAMGRNDVGQLGIGSSENYMTVPVYVTNNVVSAAGGWTSSLFVKGDGTAWAMGGNDEGQLGNGSAVTQTTVPVQAYSLGVANLAAGSDAYTHVLEVGVPVAPAITAQPVASQTVLAGTNVAFSVTASGYSPLSYQWFFGGNAISGVISGATNNNYGMTNVPVASSGNYWVVITNQFGSVTSSVARLTVVPMVINLQPTNQVVADGGTVNLSLGITNSPAAVSYQWWKDNAKLAGATNTTLSLTNAGVTNSGVYYAVATNQYGIVISSPADVAVGSPNLLAWGNNNYGQLGNGTYNNASAPLTVVSNVVSAAVGHWHSLFLKGDGTLWAMGTNDSGQLGNGTTNSTSVPVYVTNNVVSVAAGNYYSLFLKSDGTVWAMGDNSYGQLGNGTYTSTNVPVYVTSNVVSVAAGGWHSLLVKSDGTLWAMGYNQYGELGNGNTANTNVPVYVTNNVAGVAGGAYHSLFMKSDGTLWAMGQNTYGQLGNVSVATQTTVPVYVTNNVAGVAAGRWHSLFVKSDGTLWAMGYNYYGQLGIGSAVVQTNVPVYVTNNVAGVAAGYWHSLFLKSDGTLWTMGDNTYGQLGNGSAVTQTNVPVKVYSLGVANLAAGSVAFHALEAGVPVAPAITAQSLVSQTVLAGTNVGFSVTASGYSPLSYQWFFGGNVISGATNNNYGMTNVPVASSGNYWVVITNQFGSVTSSVARLTVVPMVINLQPTNQVVTNGGTVTLSLGITNSLAPVSYQWWKDNFLLAGATNAALNLANAWVTNSGVYYAVATNQYGMVISSPADVTVGSPNLLAWGTNGQGQLGIGGNTNASVPLTVVSNVVSAAAGSGHSLFVKSDGTLWAMGTNGYGQLGNGTTNSTNVPVYVTNNLVSVAAGQNHSLFLKNDGTLWAMGTNGYGQLGNGTTNNASVPVYVTSNVVSVVAGALHSLLVKSDGTLWAMGYNVDGELGNGTYTSTNVPVYVTNNVVSAAAGAGHSLFVKSDGTMWAMGGNSYGQLGNGTTNDAHVPVYVTNNVMSVTAGAFHSLFLKSDGILWAMGYNAYGQLGNGSTNNANVPVKAYSAGVANLAFGPAANHTLEAGVPLPPVITAQPASQTVPAGANLTISMGVVGYSPLSFQWFFGGSAIGGATNSSYALAGAVVTNSGNYLVVITNIFGSVTSSVASLTVNRATPLVATVGATAITYGQSLGNSAVMGTMTNAGGGTVGGVFAFANTTLAPFAGTTNVSYTFAPADTTDYNSMTGTVSVVVSPATAAVTLGSLAQTYDGTAKNATATTAPAGLLVNLTYNGSANAPTNAGSYAVAGTLSDANYAGSATNTLVISQATATVTLGNLAQTYDGTAKSATATTVPAGLTVNLTYDGSANAPTNAGRYAVVGTISDANYSGSATNTLVITGFLYWDGGAVNIATNGDGISQGAAGTWNNIIQNWDQGGALPHLAWISGTNAVFSASGIGATGGLVTLGDAITANTITVATTNYIFTDAGNSAHTLTVNAVTNSQSVIMSNNIVNAAGFTKAGSGTLSLYSTSAGLTGPLTVAGGVLQLGNGSSSVYPVGFGAVAVSNGACLNLWPNASKTYSQNISGAGSLYVGANSSGSTVTLAGSNTFTGSVTINSATLSVNTISEAGPNNLGQGTNIIIGVSGSASSSGLNYYGGGETSSRTITLGGTAASTLFINAYGTGTLAMNGPVTFSDSGATEHYLTLGGSSNGVYGGTIPDNKSNVTCVNKTGTSSWSLIGSNTYSGGTTIGGGTVLITNDCGLGAATGPVIFSASAQLRAYGADVTLGAGRTILINGGSLTATFAVADTHNLNVASFITGPGSIQKYSVSSSYGAIRFSNDTNNFTGAFSVGYGTTEFTSLADSGTPCSLGLGTSNSGTITIGNSSSAGILRYVGASNSATHRLLYWNATLGPIWLDNIGIGAIAYLNTNQLVYGAGSKTLTLQGSNSGTNTLAQVINDNGGSTTLVKAGGCAWMLSGANNYSGSTTVSGGTLALSGSGTISGSPMLYFAAGTTFDVSGVNGGYTLAGSQTLVATNGAAATINGSLNLGSAALNLGYTNGIQAINVTGGALTLASGNVITVYVKGASLGAGNYKLISKGAGGSVAGTAPASVVINTNGLVAGTVASLSISNNELYLVIKATAPVTLGSLAQTYTGGALSATATTVPAGLTVNLTYDGSVNAPVNAGSYTVVGTISDANYSGSATNTLVISKATAPVTLGSLAQTYTGSALNATATTVPVGLTVNLTYNGSANAPTNVASYAVVGTISDVNYSGSTNGTLIINQATPLVGAVSATAVTYGYALTNSILSGTVTNSAGMVVPGSFSFTNGAIVPNAGTTNVGYVFTPTDTTDYANVYGMVTVAITKATPIAQLAATASAITYGQTLNHSTITVGSFTNTQGQAVAINSYGFVNPDLAPDAGVTNVTVFYLPDDSVNYNNVTNSIAVNVAPAPSVVTYTGTAFTYDGTAKSPIIGISGSTGAKTTNYVGNGYASVNAPTNAGSYYVSNTVAADANYFGTTNHQAFMINQTVPAFSLISSEYPAAGYKDSLTFAAASFSTNASGTVQFQTNGVNLGGTVTISGGSAVSVAVAGLPRATTNVVAAIYSGDNNYLSLTNTLMQTVTNHPPMAAALSIIRTAGSSVHIALTNLAAHWLDADGDTINLIGVAPQSTNHIYLQKVGWIGSVTTNTANFKYFFIGYTNSPNVNDQFTYTISDNYGGTNTGTVNVIVDTSALFGQGNPQLTSIPGGVQMTFYGIPGDTYVVQRELQLDNSWINLITNTPVSGPITITDTNNPTAYYRLSWQP